MLHFAPRYGIVSPCLMWGRSRLRDLPVCRPANDNASHRAYHRTGNGATCAGANDDITSHGHAMLEAALRMFAAHGLSAGLRACEAAEIAADVGDQEGVAWWLEVCATFDGALARTAARSFAARQMGGR